MYVLRTAPSFLLIQILFFILNTQPPPVLGVPVARTAPRASLGQKRAPLNKFAAQPALHKEVNTHKKRSLKITLSCCASSRDLLLPILPGRDTAIHRTKNNPGLFWQAAREVSAFTRAVNTIPVSTAKFPKTLHLHTWYRKGRVKQERKLSDRPPTGK